MPDTALHPSIVALVSLAANIAANHPKQGLCQLERLRGYGISEEQIALAIDIARHIRDEASQKLMDIPGVGLLTATAAVASNPSIGARTWATSGSGLPTMVSRLGSTRS